MQLPLFFCDYWHTNQCVLQNYFETTIHFQKMTMRKLATLLLLTIFAISFVGDAHAQFWKKKSKRHSHKHHKNKKDKEEEQTEKAGKTEDVKQPEEKPAKKSKADRKKEKKEQKKREKEEKKKKEREEKKENKDKKKKGKKGAANSDKSANTAPVIKKWSDIEYAVSQKKAHYRIDILAPLYLDELVKNGYPVKNIPEKAVAGLDFYKGVQIAADTLKKAQFDIDIYVHDVASLLESTDMLVNKNMMDSADLIIGAVSAKDVAQLARYAKTKNINFISTLTTADGSVKDDQYFTILQPSLKSHCEWIAEDIMKIHTKKKPVLIHRTKSPEDDNAYKYLIADKDHKNTFTQLLSNTIPGKDLLIPLIDTSSTNFIVSATMDNGYADSLLEKLRSDFPGVRFEIYGMPSWSTPMLAKKSEGYHNISINLTAPFSYDQQSAQGKYVAKVFKKEYGGKPQDMVYRGYETMFWYANLLKRYGTIFNKQYADYETAPFTKFDIKPQWDQTGNVIYHENRHIVLTTYKNGVISTRE